MVCICCWLLLAAAGCCWLLLAAAGCCWLLLLHGGCCDQVQWNQSCGSLLKTVPWQAGHTAMTSKQAIQLLVDADLQPEEDGLGRPAGWPGQLD